jgi:hypothetical protein
MSAQDIIPRLTDTLDSLRGDRAYGRVSRDVVRAVRREHARGLVVAARLNAGAHAARTGLMNTGMLSKDEEYLLQFAPLGEARYKAIVDAYAIYAAGEVGNL